ncbi:hypothetical protein HanXRQr2_Chr15g0679921 [Helianthus annuus]|uniref:Uncharacterized protein n=1 Tax=Helianthus annuus TaxID=4232 RepID=A0A9K3DZG8_HELAN|nr:hypothetical protein HanXRQr2_Chr15g0679921 [Helianthus annuus]
MQPAFFHFGILPPPSPFPLVLTGQHRPRAWLTPYRNIPLSVQRVNRHFHGPKEVPHIVTGYISHRVPLHQATRATIQPFKNRIHLNNRNLRSSPGRLVFSLTRDPSPQTLQRPPQRSHLPHTAAFLMTVFIERKQTFRSNQSLHFNSVGEHVFDPNAVVFLNCIEKLVCFRV